MAPEHSFYFWNNPANQGRIPENSCGLPARPQAPGYPTGEQRAVSELAGFVLRV
jgi:hypothetical protein